MKMQNQALPPLPKTAQRPRVLRQAKVDADLWAAVEKEMKKQGLKIQDVMEWGLQAFLAKSGVKYQKD